MNKVEILLLDILQRVFSIKMYVSIDNIYFAEVTLMPGWTAFYEESTLESLLVKIASEF